MAQIPPWVPALSSCIAQSPRPHTFTFCTVSRDNMPRARTCVFRSWLFNDPSTGVLIFTTDQRSSKISDLIYQDGKYEACFYFPAMSMQVRLSGFTQILSYHQYPTAMDIASSSGPGRHPPSPTGTPAFYPTTSAHPAAAAAMSQMPPNTISHAMFANQHQTSYNPPSKKYPVYSPTYKSTHDMFSSSQGRAPAPSPDEWRAEFLRVWSTMRQSAQASFRRPPPGSPMSPPSHSAIDKIARGVDGYSDESGLENFTVLVMFVNHADCLTDRYMNRRVLYHRVNEGEWVEEEVCP